ncbi:kynurenine formamidase [Rhodoligotrophos appendicifer]|uniref:cyclase family protein n=1 Tax=Rhodoligotrophos appendicifer TaxID=987056 RepID=UPI00118632A3|nr:cyclase family protein [Rhodoligotrophos appendicifer]
MCVAGCHEAVAKSLSRRRLLSGSVVAAGALASLAGSGAGAGALAAGGKAFSKVVDLTLLLTDDFPTYGGTQGFTLEPVTTIASDGYNTNRWIVDEHTGTHIDAPLHFINDGIDVSQIAVDTLVAPLVVVDIREKAAKDADAMVEVADLERWEKAHGAIPDGAVVVMMSGWDKHLGTDMYRNAAEGGVMHFPGFSPAAAKWMLERKIAGLGVDTLSQDRGISKDFAVHVAWLGAGRFGIEAMGNLDQVPAAGATLVIGAPKIKGATGGPTRVLALV